VLGRGEKEKREEDDTGEGDDEGNYDIHNKSGDSFESNYESSDT